MKLPLVLVTLIVLLAAGTTALVGPAGTAEAALGTPTYANHVGPSSIAGGAGEPSIGVLQDGSVMFQAYTRSLHVRFDDSTTPPTATWVNRKPPTSIFNIDPILATDAATGRTWAGGLNGECSILSYSDNAGLTWTPVVNACAGTFDHQTIGSGPYKGAPPAGATYPRAVYYCAQLVAAACAASYNGGLTFNHPVPILGLCGGLHGHVKVGPDGTAYLPFKSCSGRMGLAYSNDNGLTWLSRVAPASTPNSLHPPRGFDPSVAVSAGNVLYVGWQGQDNHPMVAVSTNGGVTYPIVRDLSTTTSPPIVQSTFHAMVVGDDDRAALAFLGSTTPGNAFAEGWAGEWHLYVSHTFDGGLTWTTVKVTNDPVQRGWICADGTGCPSSTPGGAQRGRNLLDFMDAGVDATGRVIVGYADGCIGACAGPSGTAAQSTADLGVIARQMGGKTLRAAYD